MPLTGREAILKQFVADGFRYMFGNPGTVEEGFLDALEQTPELRYVLTLQESVAVMTADGYARAARRPALVQIHSTPGLGNSIGALYQAMRGHSPLVVIGGDAGIRYQSMDSQMAGDLVGMAKPVTKWATNGIIGFFRTPSSGLRRFPACEVKRVMQGEPAPAFLKELADADKAHYHEKWEGGWRRHEKVFKKKDL